MRQSGGREEGSQGTSSEKGKGVRAPFQERILRLAAATLPNERSYEARYYPGKYLQSRRLPSNCERFRDDEQRALVTRSSL